MVIIKFLFVVLYCSHQYKLELVIKCFFKFLFSF